ncbi:MAG: SDR family oxidoreductase [Pseudomonadota bacterium]
MQPITYESAVISGASRGIGAAIAVRLAELGVNSCLLGRDNDALEEVAEQCRAAGAQADTAAGDVRDESYLKRTCEKAIGRFGGVDILINNAGMAVGGGVTDADLDAWRGVMDVNLFSTMALTKHLSVGMIERKLGAIINISSISGRHTAAGNSIYAASKHALNGFTGCLFEDLREFGIKVSAIMPGFVATSLTEKLALDDANMIQPGDVADAVEYVLRSSPHSCPSEIVLRPQLRP